jgi:hypothetical protein
MANEVYANNNEISCKSGEGKVVASFPDVCLSPPSPPAGPVPIPYPVSSFSSDATDGSKTVQISGKEVMLKDKSYFSKCTGDEAATKSLGMGVVSHNITGKVYFAAWSMDVKFEGLNVDRNLDLTTSNHMSPNGNTPPMVEIDGMSVPADVEPCKCKYKRPHHGEDHNGDSRAQTPNGPQTDYVNGPDSFCWICGQAKMPNVKFIADHQPSLAERWYTNKDASGNSASGCMSEAKFKKDALSTPGSPAGNKEYHVLKPRCKTCFSKQPLKGLDGNLTANVSGRTDTMPEGSYENAKSSRLRQRVQDKHNVEPKDC